MSVTVEAIYENGVLKFDQPLPFEEHAAVRVTIEPALTSAVTHSKCAVDLARILAHAGAVDLGKATGLDNERIDADLACEYGSSNDGAQ